MNLKHRNANQRQNTPTHTSVKIAVISSEAELVFEPQDGQAVANCLLDLWFEVRMLVQQTLVGLTAKFCMLVHVFNLWCWSEASSHKSRRARLHLRKLIEMITHILTPC